MTTKQVSYRLFGQTILLLLLYAAASLISGVKFLGEDPLAVSVPYQQITAFSHVLLNLAIVTGLLGSGLYMISGEDTPASTVLVWTARGWMLLLVLAFLAGIFGLLENRHMLELPPLLDVLQALLMGSFVAHVFIIDKQPKAMTIVWLVGMIVVVVCTLLGLIGITDAVRDNLVRGLTVGLMINVGYTLAAVATSFWLIRDDATETHAYSVAGLATVAGVLVTIASLNSLGGDDLSRLLSIAGAVLTPAYVLFAVYSYRKARQGQMLGIVLFIMSGVIGGLQALPSINQWTQGTRLTELHMTLTLWAVTAIVLAIIQRVSVQQSRLSPASFWLAAGGIFIGGVALAGAGLVQTYMERILSIGYLETQVYLIPLYAFWMIGSLILAAGLAVYALRYFFNRA